MDRETLAGGRGVGGSSTGGAQTTGLHPVLRAAGEDGRLPSWARCSPDRKAHARRVAALLGEWGDALDLPPDDRVRWRAAGLLHDAVKDADRDELRRLVEGADESDEYPGEWADPLLHAPACAILLRRDGVEDGPLLRAIAFHPVGHPAFDRLGEGLYLADFLDPERQTLREERRRLRESLPTEPPRWRAALLEAMKRRFERVLQAEKAVRPESVAFWNARVDG